ncbi:hypothetical protein FACS1894158_14570 [Betaproteobacteria bacterium]|nr:hypothetical protein FACS1894158_14570 [Betaproteobacteria bacterium]
MLDINRRRLAFDDDRRIVWRVIIRRRRIPRTPEWRADDNADAYTAVPMAITMVTAVPSTAATASVG